MNMTSCSLPTEESFDVGAWVAGISRLTNPLAICPYEHMHVASDLYTKQSARLNLLSVDDLIKFSLSFQLVTDHASSILFIDI